VIVGEADGVRGPVTEIAATPIYLDVSVPAGSRFEQPTPRGHTAFAYVFRGEGCFGSGEGAKEVTVSEPHLVVFGDGDVVQVVARDRAVRFLFASGKPSHEPIVRHGPFVMNTREEIAQALEDLRTGTFVK
jgi:redox-sensitive bicupin YhaK (pirin superfamily)